MSFLVATILFFLVAAGFGGLRWYLGSLDKKLASLEEQRITNFAALRGPRVDRVAYFADRLNLIDTQAQGEGVNVEQRLTEIEGLIVPNVRLTRYEYNDAEKFVSLTGETDNFKYVAQQIISLKSNARLAKVEVESIARTNEGRVVFTLKAAF